MNGWSVIGSHGGGLTEFRANLNNVTFGPSCAWLLGNSNTNGYSGPVDQTYAVGITDDGGIALAGPSGIVDQVGLSRGSAFGEGARLTNFGTSNGNRSYERIADTDNNASNFRLISPSSPQTSGGGCTIQPTPASPGVTGSASPNTVVAGGEALLTATVSPGMNPTSTGLGVAVAAGAIGIAGNTQLLDNGAGGDATAGDNVFWRSVTVAPGTSAGAKSLPITVTDAQGRGGNGAFSSTCRCRRSLRRPRQSRHRSSLPTPLTATSVRAWSSV